MLAGMLTLVKSYEWVGYVYFDDGTTALVWKGMFIDLWAYDETVFESVSRVFTRCGLISTEKVSIPVHPYPQ
jgi:hypothetical protein